MFRCRGRTIAQSANVKYVTINNKLVVSKRTIPGERSWTFDGTRLFWVSQPPVVSISPCKCGGGRFLGTIHSIPMYDNHTTECSSAKELYSLLNKDYFNILKSFEFATKDATDIKYNERLLRLILAWKNCETFLVENGCTEICGTFMHQAISDSALLILDPAWKDVDANIKYNLTQVLKKVWKLMESDANMIKVCSLLLSLIINPWQNKILLKIFNGVASHDEIANLMEFESSSIYALRLRILCRLECEAEIFRLSSMAMNMYNSELKYRQYFEEQDFEFIRDIYYACLVWFDRKPELIYHIMRYSHNDGKVLLKSYYSKIEGILQFPIKVLPRVYKCIITVAEIASSVLVANSLTNSNFYNDFSELLKLWSIIIVTLMKSNLEFNMSGLHLNNMIKRFVTMAPTARHLYMICDVLYDEFGSKLPRSTSIYVYIQALRNNINEMDLFKYLSDNDRLLISLKMLAQRYLKLANQLDDILYVYRECILTAYCLIPSCDLLEKIEMLAIQSGKLFTEHPTNVLKYFCNNNVSTVDSEPVDYDKFSGKHKSITCKYDKMLNACDHRECSYYKIHDNISSLPDPLLQHVIDDFISVIKCPRSSGFDWYLKWPELKILCKTYLEYLVTNQNILRQSDFKHLNIDIKEYMKERRRLIISRTNCTDTFSSDEEMLDDEESE